MAARNLIPLSRFPQGKAGAGTVPPTAQTTRLPPQEGFQSAPLKSPLRDPPAGRAGLHPIEKTLAGLTAGTVQHLLVLSEVRWPVLK